MRDELKYLLLLLLLIPGLIPGCAVLRNDPAKGYETISAAVEADTAQAHKMNLKAIESIEEGDFEEARREIDKALIADVNHAPSHNTLGQIYFGQKNYYLAAWEYEFAIRLAPDVPEYHNNLGLVYEAADRLSDAEIQYAEAVSMSPNNFHFVSNYARLRIRRGERNEESRALLEQVVFLDPRKEWKDWARQQLSQSHLHVPSADIRNAEYPSETDSSPNGNFVPPPVTIEHDGQ